MAINSTSKKNNNTDELLNRRISFSIETLNDNGSGMSYNSAEEFLQEISMMIDDCIANGGTYFDVQVDADASCFYNGDDEDDEDDREDEDDE